MPHNMHRISRLMKGSLLIKLNPAGQRSSPKESQLVVTVNQQQFSVPYSICIDRWKSVQAASAGCSGYTSRSLRGS